MSHIVCAVHAEVFDTYTYSDVGFDGDSCPPCIVMQPPVATLQTWMDAQDRTNPVWEEQVLPLPYSSILAWPSLPHSNYCFSLPWHAHQPWLTPVPTPALSQLLVSSAMASPLAWRTPPPFVPPSKKSGSASCDRGQRHLAIKWHLCKTGSCSNFLDFLTPPSSAQPTVLPCPALFTQEHVVLQKDSGISLDFVSAHLLYVQVLCSM